MVEKISDQKAILIGAITYSAGLVLFSAALTQKAHQLFKILIGFGIAITDFSIILAIVGRTSSYENGSMSLGVVTAAGNVGQVIGTPLAE